MPPGTRAGRAVTGSRFAVGGAMLLHRKDLGGGGYLVLFAVSPGLPGAAGGWALHSGAVRLSSPGPRSGGRSFVPRHWSLLSQGRLPVCWRNLVIHGVAQGGGDFAFQSDLSPLQGPFRA